MTCFHELHTTLVISIWKFPCQKLYVVTFSNIQECNCGPNHSTRSLFIDISDSSDDNLEREKPSKKTQERRHKRCDNKMLQRLSNEVRDIMADMMSLTVNTNLLIGLRSVLRDTFKCHICHSIPVRPPLIVTKCC